MRVLKNNLLLVLVIVFSLVVLARPVYSQSEIDQKPQQAKPFSADDITKLEKIVSKLRELPFKNQVKVSINNKKELRQKMIENYEKEDSNKESLKIQKALAKFGLIPKNINLNKLMLDLLTEQIAGFYDPEIKELCIIKPDENEKLPADAETIEAMYGIPYYNITAVHELTHALQDQHYDLRSLPMDSMENDDIATAVQSLIEGEATYVMYDYMLRRLGMDLALIPDMTKNINLSPPAGSDLIGQSPTYIRESLLFPYTYGFGFVHKIKSEKGWEVIDEMYKKLPASTEQILHPAKYADETPDYPTTVTLPDLSGLFPSEQYEMLLKNVIGEFTLEIFIREYLPNIKSKRIASGWDGDEFIILERKALSLSTEQQEKVKSLIAKLEAADPSNKEHAEKEMLQTGMPAIPFLQEIKERSDSREIKTYFNYLIEVIRDNNTSSVWFITWDTVKDAQEFYDAYFKLVAKKYDDSEIIEQDGTKTIWLSGDNLILLEIKERDTLVIETVPEKILPVLASLVWKEVRKEELKEVKRIDPEKKKSKSTSDGQEENKKENKK